MKLYVDMLGVLCKRNKIHYLEDIYQTGYFKNMDPISNVVDGIKKFFTFPQNEIEVFIILPCIDSKYAKQDLNEWIDNHIPEVDEEHRIFINYKDDMVDTIIKINQGLDKTSILLDDYSDDLTRWDKQGGIAIKLISSISHKTKQWSGSTIDHSLSPGIFYYTLKRLVVQQYVQERTLQDIS